MTQSDEVLDSPSKTQTSGKEMRNWMGVSEKVSAK
jgi:hypothetical protein